MNSSNLVVPRKSQQHISSRKLKCQYKFNVVMMCVWLHAYQAKFTLAPNQDKLDNKNLVTLPNIFLDFICSVSQPVRAFS